MEFRIAVSVGFLPLGRDCRNQFSNVTDILIAVVVINTIITAIVIIKFTTIVIIIVIINASTSTSPFKTNDMQTNFHNVRDMREISLG